LRQLAWVPVPLLILSIIALRFADLGTAYHSPFLFVALPFVFTTLVSVFVAYLIGRSFISRGTPGLLLMGCGVLFWGMAGFVAGAVSHGDANVSVTIHNICTWLAALCLLVGVVISRRTKWPIRAAGLWLASAYTGTVGAVGVVALSARANHFPLFFIQGQGGTSLRYLVVGSAIGMFAVTAGWLAMRRPLTAFAYWYALSLALIAIGLFAVMIEPANGSTVSWFGRGTQFLGGAYMLIAAVASVRENRVWGIPLESALLAAEQRYRALVDLAPDAVVVHQDNRFVYANTAGLRLYGAQALEQLCGQNCLELVHPDERDAARQRLQLVKTGIPSPLRESRILRLDGQVVPVEATAAAIQWLGKQAVQVIIRDITERKRSEEALRQAHEQLEKQVEVRTAQLLESQRLAHLGNWEWESKTDTVTWSDELYQLMGIDPDLPAVPFKEHGKLFTPESWVKLEKGVEQALRTGESYEIDLEAIRTDGTHRWLTARGAVVLDGRGNATGLRGTVQDITERKQIEQELLNLSGHLINAQEEERVRIARELHDDFSQRLALLSVKLGIFVQKSPQSYEQTLEVLADLAKRIKDISIDIHRLSHQLHPAILEIGLEPAIRSLCKELQEQSGILITCSCKDVPRTLPKELSLCVFRVVQEALGNVIKHSGATDAEVAIHGNRNHITLSISDSGQGFDENSASPPGLGLLSMKERVRLLGGQLRLQSHASFGTAIEVDIPITAVKPAKSFSETA
jgi:PAS domain S-box-containing protein